jgi:hypothetical protein
MTWHEIFEDHLYYVVTLIVLSPVAFGIGLIGGIILGEISGL